ncbi:hypothetical protein CSUB01_08028 [Colletotrichum sublineola]|uniref:Uncharacterized protein n=1 Tax=Colletotrichum sublineola TaxID=1173701 RepID=A0A066WV73_COLSU|nr:hypothetical protein CSUB01_08028 [Colletotrichum sublineola]
MSLLCFYFAAQLAFLSSSVHMNCLVALEPYFEEHPRQARVRIWLMAFLLILILTTDFIIYFTYYNSEEETIACAIRHYQTDWPYHFVTWLAVCWWVISGFRMSMYQLRTARSEFPYVFSLAYWALNAVCRDWASRRELEAWNEGEMQKIRGEYRRRCHLLQKRSSKPPWRVTAPIVARAIVSDVWQSLIFMAFWNLSYVVIGLYFIGAILSSPNIDYTQLLEPNFGQVLPLIMLIVLPFNIMEASGSSPETDGQSEARSDSPPRTSTETGELTLLLPERISRQDANEWVIPPRKRDIGFEDHWQAGAEASISGGLEGRQTGDNAREQHLDADRLTTTVPEESETNSVQLPNRTNTLVVEAGVSLPSQFSPADPM